MPFHFTIINLLLSIDENGASPPIFISALDPPLRSPIENLWVSLFCLPQGRVRWDGIPFVTSNRFGKARQRYRYFILSRGNSCIYAGCDFIIPFYLLPFWGLKLVGKDSLTSSTNSIYRSRKTISNFYNFNCFFNNSQLF